jgi:hypothetical protein
VFAAPSVVIGKGASVNRSFIRIPVLCAAIVKTRCVGTITVLSGRVVMANDPLSIAPGSRIIKLRPIRSVALIKSTVVVRIQTIGTDGSLRKFSKKIRVN